MAEITDRRNIGITRQDIADLLAAHSGDADAVRTAALAAHPNLGVDYITVDGGAQVLLIDYIISDLPSYT